jgi:predicted N-acetyltransferase YhbS
MITQPHAVTLREATAADAAGVVAVYHAAYGDGYVHPRFYDEHEIRKMIYDDDTLMLVAEDDESGRIVGAAAVHAGSLLGPGG